MEILNLYAGIGGNRKLWKDVNVTAVEYNKEIAEIYQDFFPNDKVIVGDAHEYLLNNFDKFDFIWSSPPCPTHSIVRYVATRDKKTNEIRQRPVFPDMKLYEEIIFLKHYCKAKWVVENVKPYYEPLLKPQNIGRHCFWANFVIDSIKHGIGLHYSDIDEVQKVKGFNLDKYNIANKKQILRNCVLSEVGLNILECSKRKNLF
ncbi:MAG: DNA cytosine methyltransferase [PVC group bacterium]|nr:DNA cytosine methyltransferase [PVC group bacterium]